VNARKQISNNLVATKDSLARNKVLWLLPDILYLDTVRKEFKNIVMPHVMRLLPFC
jgi:hypothetical protein